MAIRLARRQSKSRKMFEDPSEIFQRIIRKETSPLSSIKHRDLSEARMVLDSIADLMAEK